MGSSRVSENLDSNWVLEIDKVDILQSSNAIASGLSG